MKVLIVNAILYTSESKKVKKVSSIKDCMIYDLCKAFYEKGHEVTLIAADDYRPINKEEYPFKIIWMKSYLPKVFIPNKIPYNHGITKYINSHNFDLIICSEVFSLDTLMAVRSKNKNIIIWQEMAFHQKMAKQMASKFWHNVIVKHRYKSVRIVPRTENAKRFISNYSNNVSPNIIPHGVDTEKFHAVEEKEDYFVVVSQLIERKRIDQIIQAFADYREKENKQFLMYILGDGDQADALRKLAKSLLVSDAVIFTGKKNHDDMVDILSRARAMLVYTRKDNSMISIAESLSVCTPVLTTSVPDNALSIKENELGIVKDEWTWKELKTIVCDNERFVNNCLKYRDQLDNKHNVDMFIEEMNNR